MLRAVQHGEHDDAALAGYVVDDVREDAKDGTPDLAFDDLVRLWVVEEEPVRALELGGEAVRKRREPCCRYRTRAERTSLAA